MNHKEPKKLDIDAVLKSKAKTHYNKIPKVAINYLKRKVHQDELNYIIETYRNEHGSDFMKACVDYFNLTLHTKGKENIPEVGKFVFVSNHPLGGLDGICLAATLGERYDKKIKYLVNDILLNIENLESILIQINKHVHFEGRNSNFFYNLSNLRMKVGVKLNVEMLYLADEMMKKKNAEFTITFGKPISWQSLDNSMTPVQWAQKIKESVYTLNQI